MQVRKIVANESAQQCHKLPDFRRRPRPILGAERENGKKANAEVAGGTNRTAQRLYPAAVPLSSWQAARRCPASIPVHDDGNVPRHGTYRRSEQRATARFWTFCLKSSHREDFLFFRRHHPVDFRDRFVGRFLHLFGRAFALVLAYLVILFEFLEYVEAVAPYMTHRYSRGLGIFVGDFHQLPATLLVELGDAQAQQLPFR